MLGDLHTHKVLLFWQGTGAMWELELSDLRVVQGGGGAAARTYCSHFELHITVCVLFYRLDIC